MGRFCEGNLRERSRERERERETEREREKRDFATSIQPAWLRRTGLCSCLGHLQKHHGQNGCEAMADSLLIFVPHEQTHRASSILKQIGILSPDGSKARAVENVMKQEAELKLPEEFLHSHTHTHTPPPPGDS